MPESKTIKPLQPAIRHAVTHEGRFELKGGKAAKLIYSGMDTSPIVLTVTLETPPNESVVEVLVEPTALPEDAVICQVGVESRTFKIRSAKKIRLQLNEKYSSVKGSYMISVLF